MWGAGVYLVLINFKSLCQYIMFLWNVLSYLSSFYLVCNIYRNPENNMLFQHQNFLWFQMIWNAINENNLEKNVMRDTWEEWLIYLNDQDTHQIVSKINASLLFQKIFGSLFGWPSLSASINSSMSSWLIMVVQYTTAYYDRDNIPRLVYCYFPGASEKAL